MEVDSVPKSLRKQGWFGSFSLNAEDHEYVNMLMKSKLASRKAGWEKEKGHIQSV